ncbi:MAG: glucose-6-phosphate isomerase [Alphaproteobacteria bacterium]|nr:glucose-6-phosphate isomerase [Alphaproteobacteria bacterium]
MAPATWTRVETEARRLGALDLRTVAQRSDLDSFIWRAPHLEADVAKQPIDAGAMSAMLAFARERDLAGHIEKLFAGGIVNASENRPALHWALRGGGEEISAVADMRRQQAEATAFAKSARSGGLGFEVKTILHVGIGGSDLGPRLVWDALRSYGAAGPEIRFCANIDPEDFLEATTGVDPATTLVLVVSKSFKTPETASNARLAREWLVKALGETAANQHLAAVSSAPDRARAWGAGEDRIFPMDEAVGGRYSLWSSVGLSLQIALGPDIWARLLAGGREMDNHFRTTGLQENTPARLAMMDVFLATALDIPSRPVLAYAHRLRRLPDFLQQLEMESNGKSAADSADGRVGDTAPVVWGSVGTLGQHSFHQLLHQGTRRHAIEFVAALDAGAGDTARGRALLANAFAQAEGLLAGRSAAEAEAQLLAQGVDPVRARKQARDMDMPGQHGSTTLLLDALTPESLGALIALYEHRTFAAGVLWGVNPFDQWGVERGKVLAEELDAAIAGADPGNRDPSTLRLVQQARNAAR